MRIQHRLNANSVKISNRPGVLRLETTINNTQEFKVFRTKTNWPGWQDGKLGYLRMRMGIADLHRRTEVSRQLAPLRAHGIIEKVSKSHRDRVTPNGRQTLTALLNAANASTRQLAA